MWIDRWLDRFQDKRHDQERRDDGRQPGVVREPTPADPSAETSPSRPLAPGARLVAQTQAWGFSTALARQAVNAQPWKELAAGWRLSAKALESERIPYRRLALVMLRAAILDEMEAQRPEAFAAWLAEQGPAEGRRRRE